MLEITGTKIRLTRGDSAYITVIPYVGKGDDRRPYELGEGDSIHAQIRTAPNTGEIVAVGTILYEENGDIVWYLQPSDTKDLPVKKYWYDVELDLSNGDIFTFIKASPFTLTDEVTMHD